MCKSDAYVEILSGIQAGKIRFEVGEWSGEDRKAYRDDVRVKEERGEKRKRDQRWPILQ